MNEVRALRRGAGLSQHAFAQVMGVPLNTLRMWDSGLRRIPVAMLQRARETVAQWDRQHELSPLGRLPSELGVHVRTVQAAARTGRLAVHFSSRSVFGRPIRFATRAAGEEFKQRYYRRFGGQEVCAIPLPAVPADYDERLKRLRRRLRLSQQAFAKTIGAAGKAVIYQWESRKRCPSPVFWRKVEALERRPRHRPVITKDVY